MERRGGSGRNERALQVVGTGRPAGALAWRPDPFSRGGTVELHPLWEKGPAGPQNAPVLYAHCAMAPHKTGFGDAGIMERAILWVLRGEPHKRLKEQELGREGTRGGRFKVKFWHLSLFFFSPVFRFLFRVCKCWVQAENSLLKNKIQEDWKELSQLHFLCNFSLL